MLADGPVNSQLHVGNGHQGLHKSRSKQHLDDEPGAKEGPVQTKLRQYVSSLNEQFARWVAQQREQKPERLWSHGLMDYLRHSVIIKRDCANEIASQSEDEDGKIGGIANSKGREAQLMIMPLRHTKTVYFIRHGEGYHNIGVVNEDAHLTDMGWRQAEALHQHLGNMRPPPDIQLVVSSPLTRALETAVGAFGGGKWQGRGSILMMDQTAIPGIRAGHDTVASVAGLPFIAFEGCRERLGPAACDRRRDIRLAKKQFPGVDFSHIETNHDEVYEKHRMESEHAVQERGARFLQWLMARQESHIAVVTHCGFLFMMLSSYGHDCAPIVQEELHRGFENCEMRAVVLSDASGPGKMNPSWFAGGRRSVI